MRSRADTLSRTAALVALAAALGYAEAVLLPPLPVPGLRVGVANVAVVVALAVLGARPALAVSLARVLLVGLATASLGGPATAMASAGAVCAWAAMTALSRIRGAFSPVGWSVAGAAAHVAAQLGVASMLIGSPAPLALAPLAFALSLFAGLGTGFLARTLLARVPRSLSRSLASGQGTGEGAGSGAVTAGEL